MSVRPRQKKKKSLSAAEKAKIAERRAKKAAKRAAKKKIVPGSDKAKKTGRGGGDAP